MQTWKRGQMFYYFSQMAPTGYSLTANIDVTHLTDTLKQQGIKFFPAYLWLVTRNLNRQQEFKVAVRDGVLGSWDTLTPLYTTFHDDDKTFSLAWTEYSDSFYVFYRSYLENQEKYGGVHGVLSQPAPPPENAYTVSCIPWIEFTHFAVHSYENKSYYFPSVEAGRFTRHGERVTMPLSLTCHHATTDGYHVSEFLRTLQDDMDSFDTFLPLNKPTEVLI